jgi:hypothetical protein
MLNIVILLVSLLMLFDTIASLLLLPLHHTSIILKKYETLIMNKDKGYLVR